MKLVVLDTSALVRLYIPDGPLPDGAEEAIEEAAKAETVVLVPELALVEVAQVVHKKSASGLLSANEADEILGGVLELPLEVVGHRELVQLATQAARRHSLTVYDGLFLALADAKRATLITADDALRRAWVNHSR